MFIYDFTSSSHGSHFEDLAQLLIKYIDDIFLLKKLLTI